MRFVSLFSGACTLAALLALQLPCDAGASEPEHIRVSPQIQAAKLIKKVSPAYPEEAKQKNLRGTVRLTIKVAPDGSVASADVVSGDQVLAEAAKQAVLQWQYKPTQLEGRPADVVTEVDLRFPEDAGHGVVGGVPAKAARH